ncbi:IpaD/SipD/SspD family type III secretion system needle tip protein [Chromobacterium piscinae]|uniref:IpaD/SipD/SspD family type III secretion system needle tip protein n=1 Tax=Chromobacterium piscinae TaxID=686831 RepID=UPI003F7DE9F9
MLDIHHHIASAGLPNLQAPNNEEAPAPTPSVKTAPNNNSRPAGDPKPLQHALTASQRFSDTLAPLFRAVTTGKTSVGDDNQLAWHQLDGRLRSLAAGKVALPAPLAESFAVGSERVFRSESPFVRSQVARMATGSSLSNGHDDFALWDTISQYIGQVNTDYLGVFQDATSKYVKFYSEFSDTVMSPLSNWITTANDEKKGEQITLDTDSLRNALTALKSKYQDVALWSATPNGKNHQSAVEWAKQLGLPDTCAKGDKVVIDMSAIDKMIEDLPKEKTMDSAKFQAWKAGFDAEEEKMKNTLQTLTQKYSNANSLFDNLVKVLSSTISACQETAKSFLQI